MVVVLAAVDADVLPHPVIRASAGSLLQNAGRSGQDAALRSGKLLELPVTRLARWIVPG
jgi:hypothetical protein